MEKTEIQTDNNGLTGSAGKEGIQGTLGAERRRWQPGHPGCRAIPGLPCRVMPRGHVQSGAAGPLEPPHNHFLDNPQRGWVLHTHAPVQ